MDGDGLLVPSRSSLDGVGRGDLESCDRRKRSEYVEPPKLAQRSEHPEHLTPEIADLHGLTTGSSGRQALVAQPEHWATELRR